MTNEIKEIEKVFPRETYNWGMIYAVLLFVALLFAGGFYYTYFENLKGDIDDLDIRINRLSVPKNSSENSLIEEKLEEQNQTLQNLIKKIETLNPENSLENVKERFERIINDRTGVPLLNSTLDKIEIAKIYELDIKEEDYFYTCETKVAVEYEEDLKKYEVYIKIDKLTKDLKEIEWD